MKAWLPKYTVEMLRSEGFVYTIIVNQHTQRIAFAHSRDLGWMATVGVHMRNKGITYGGQFDHWVPVMDSEL